MDAGICTFGEDFSCNTNCFISCTEKVSLGKECLLGWNVNICDADGHTTFENGDKVWIAACVDILKGVEIKDGCVIGYRSCVTKSVDRTNCLVVGCPTKVVKEHIEWKL